MMAQVRRVPPSVTRMSAAATLLLQGLRIVAGLGTAAPSPDPPVFTCIANTTNVDADFGGVIQLKSSDIPAGSTTCHMDTAWDGWVWHNERSTSFEAVVTQSQDDGESVTTVNCPLPPYLQGAEGPVALRLSVKTLNAVLSDDGLVYSNPIALWYSTRLSASFSHSPYFNTDKGELLVRTNISTPIDEIRIKVWLPGSAGEQIMLLQAAVGATSRVAIPVSLAAVDKNFRGNATVSLYDGPRHLLDRRIHLSLVSGSVVGMSGIDHRRKAVLVDSRIFLPIGWFSTYLDYGLEACIDGMRLMSTRGSNSMMVYNPAYREHAALTNNFGPLLNAAQALGIKVHVNMKEVVTPLATGSSQDYSTLDTLVMQWRRHPAVLAWYVADDFSAPLLPQVYARIKSIDPYHLVTMAISGAGDAVRLQYLEGVDLVMVEDYPDDAAGAYPTMKVVQRWPLEYMPAIHIGRVWSVPQANILWTPQMFRAQMYEAYIAGMNGELWFAFRWAEGWHEPGIPLMDASFTAASEMLDLVPTLLADTFSTKLVNVTVTATDVGGDPVPGAARVKAFQEESGCVTVMVVNSANYPVKARLQFAFGSHGIFDKDTLKSYAITPFDIASTARKVVVTNGTLEEFLPTFGVQTFRFNATSSCAVVPDPRVLVEGNLIFNPSFEEFNYISSVAVWICGMLPNETRGGASCFADSHVSYAGRHAGRFVTGLDARLFHISPQYHATDAEPAIGKFTFSVYALTSDAIALSLGRYRRDAPYVVDAVFGQRELPTTWKRIEWEVTLNSTRGDRLVLTANATGVFWLDEVSLARPAVPQVHPSSIEIQTVVL
mmetsp:Transcript_23425/g.54538  ORF Transcript_23425/g.54538 Transcript_23425/m.54538 type:complete len:828 (-) Transcript_23425:77-2560(-)